MKIEELAQSTLELVLELKQEKLVKECKNEKALKVKLSLIKKHGSLEKAYEVQKETRLKKAIEKYGTLEKFYESRNKKREEVCLKKCGKKSTNNIEKYKQTMKEKYGVENAWQLESVRKNNAIALRSEEVKKKKEKTCLRKYGFKNPGRLAEPFFGMHTSKEEQEMGNFLTTLGVDLRKNVRDVISDSEKCFELDFFFPSKNVAVEYNGIYWHCEKFKPKNYHQEKSDKCREKGIRLIHIFSTEWKDKREICESIIKSALGIFEKRIYARKCKVVDLSPFEYNEFLEKNHIHGSVNSSIRKGLVFENQIVQVIGLGFSRFEKDKLELYRMASLLNTQVIGGFSKLLKSLGNVEIVSYVDLSLFTGKGYETLGFKVVQKTPPNYRYVNTRGKVLSRFQCQKHKLKKLLPNFNPSLSEVENMHNAGFYRIFDSGNLKTIYVN